MKTYTFQSKTELNAGIDDVFEFFSNAKNLQKLTPPWLNFKMITPPTGAVQSGTTIGYKLKVHALPIHWLTLIEHWEPPRRFIDVQLKGPYKIWKHEHRFESLGDKTIMYDTVEYALPFGILGQLAHSLLVKKDVQSIFDYRTEAISKIFANSRSEQLV